MFFENEDGEDSSLEGRFGGCETSDECYVCTERVILNFELNQLEVTSDSCIGEEEQINLCLNCLASMFSPTYVGDREDVFEWNEYKLITFHTYTKN